MQSDVIGFIDDLSAGRIAGRIEVFGDCGLAIGHHGLAGEFLCVDEEPWPSLPGNRRTVMGTPLAIHARAQSDLVQKRDGAGLQHASANACQHVGAPLPFEDDTVDVVFRWRICDRSKPAGPPPMIATWVCIAVSTVA